LSEHRLAHSAKKGEFFFARFSALHFGYPKRSVGRTSRVAFSFGYFSFGEAKEQVPRLPGRDPASHRRKTNERNATKLIANKPTNPPARSKKH
jgi:hypothetical protein